MRKYLFLFYLLFIAGRLNSKPLPSKLTHSIIINTDCAIDDMRAISYLLSRPEIKTRAIILSDGTLPPIEGKVKIESLLHEFNCDSVPVALTDTLPGLNPPWRQFNRSIQWGENNGHMRSYNGTPSQLFQEAAGKTDEKIILICLGPLSDIDQIITKEPGILSKVEKIIWYNESVKPLEGFNYECDKKAYTDIVKSGIRLDVILNLKKEDTYFDTTLFNICKSSDTRLAKVLFMVHNQPEVKKKILEKHFRLNDDLVAIYLTNPELFDMDPLIPEVNVRYAKDYDAVAVREAISDMIRGQYIAGHDIVFNSFPMQRQLFTYDVRQVMDTAIARYGYEEWKANVMTDEFHGHLGVFSIVGAKMGIKARELFGVGPDMLEVVSYAGTTPPYSCLNDGIQVSVGATLGMGTIRVTSDSITQPMADFSYKGRTIRISLKNEYLEKVDSDINSGIVKFGLMDDGYWKLIRRNAIKYWVDWDRNKIFDIQELSKE